MARPDEDAFTGLGVGLGLALFGILCVGFFPTYLGATSSGWQIFWSLTGGVFGLVGLGGALIDLSKILDVKGWDDFGVVVVLGGLAGTLHVIQANGAGGWTLVVRVLVAVLLLVATLGAGIGMARLAAAAKRRKEHPSRPRGLTALSVVTVVLGLATALLNFMSVGGLTP